MAPAGSAPATSIADHAMIHASDLEFRYPDGDFVLRVPTLEIARGETVAVIGPSGTGKTCAGGCWPSRTNRYRRLRNCRSL